MLILALVGVGLVITTYFQVRIGLSPIERIRQSLQAIRAGESERLEGDFPLELAPLAQEMNALIEANGETMERARTHVGNLAHALKTPWRSSPMKRAPRTCLLPAVWPNNPR